VFELGGADDPVLKLALSSQFSTLVYTLTNTSTSATASGLISFANLFATNSAASSALQAYMADGDALKYAAAAGLILGDDTVFVPALAPGQSASVMLNVPHNAQIDMVMRVSATEFVGLDSTKILAADPLKRFALQSGKIVAKTGAAPLSVSTVHLTDCTNTLGTSTTMLDIAFNYGPWDHAWPYNIGFDGDFNGDWYTDGVTARMIDVNAKLPTITGFVKFFYVCPSAGARVSAFADIATKYTQAASDTTMVIYFLDVNNNYISHAENLPLHGNNQHRRHALYDATIPAGTRKIGVVPMGYFAAGETDSSHYYNLTLQYEPAGKVTETSLGSDDFTQFTGWTYSGGTWYNVPPYNWATAWNPAWSPGTGTRPVDTRMTKTFSLGTYKSGAALSARAFAASTFTDPASFVQMFATFDTGETVSASPVATSAWADFDIRRTPIPAGATSVTIMFQMYLGPSETSAAYVDTLQLWKVE